MFNIGDQVEVMGTYSFVGSEGLVTEVGDDILYIHIQEYKNIPEGVHEPQEWAIHKNYVRLVPLVKMEDLF